jgi:hypothetical protein
MKHASPSWSSGGHDDSGIIHFLANELDRFFPWFSTSGRLICYLFFEQLEQYT